jgi:hypothetical protein
MARVKDIEKIGAFGRRFQKCYGNRNSPDRSENLFFLSGGSMGKKIETDSGNTET